MSAKDIAFEKERVRFRKEKRELEKQLRQKDVEIESLKLTLNQKEAEMRTKEEWIDRLLEYTELSFEDMQKIVARDVINAEIAQHVNQTAKEFFSVFGRM